MSKRFEESEVRGGDQFAPGEEERLSRERNQSQYQNEAQNSSLKELQDWLKKTEQRKKEFEGAQVEGAQGNQEYLTTLNDNIEIIKDEIERRKEQK